MKWKIVPVLLSLCSFCYAQERVSLQFIGDIMQHGTQIRWALQDDGTHQYDTCFTFMAPYFAQADIVVGNMETTFNGPPYSGYPLFSAPDALATSLQHAGINVLLAANNHILDKGSSGLAKSLALFDSLGLHYVGATSPANPDGSTLLLTVKGIRIAILNYTYGINGFTPKNGTTVNLLDTLLMQRHVREVRRAGADFVIGCFHWGNEYQMQPSQAQRRWAQHGWRYGFDVIIGSHPHVPQSITLYQHPTRLIAWSLGNFISNQPDPETRMGLLVGFDVVKDSHGTHLETPYYEWIWTWRPETNGRKQYHALPVSDPTTYRDVVTNPKDSLAFLTTLQEMRAFMQQEGTNISERKRFPPYERKNLYFGDYPTLGPLRTEQPIFTPYFKGFSPIKNYSQGRTD